MTNKSWKPTNSLDTRRAQEANEEFFEQLGPQFAANVELHEFRKLKNITLYLNRDHGQTFLVEMRFKDWKTAEKNRNTLLFLRQPWYESGIYKEDVYRIGKSLFLRKLLF